MVDFKDKGTIFPVQPHRVLGSKTFFVWRGMGESMALIKEW